MATLLKTKKRTKPKFIEITDFVSDQSTSAEQTTKPSQRSSVIAKPETDSHVVTTNDSPIPSAPSEDLRQPLLPTGLANEEVRTKFMAKVFSVLFCQKITFLLLTGLFTFVPHLRKIFRKNIFDPLFLSSMIGYPLFIVPLILMAIFPKIRRKIATWSFVVLTLCLSLLLSYAITPKTAKAFLYSMGFSNGCDLGVIFGSKRKLDFTKWRYIGLIPTAMIGSGFLAPTILQMSVNYTIWPTIAMTLGSTYLMANTVPVIRHNDLNIKPDEPIFAAIQLYLNPEQMVRHKIKQWFWPTDRERTGYTAIA